MREELFELRREVNDLKNIIAKWRYMGLRGLDTGSSLGDILGKTGDLAVNGDLTIGTDGSIKWGDDAEHSIEGRTITFQNAGEAGSTAGSVKFRSSTDATRIADLVGYFGSADPDQPIAVLRAHDTDDADDGLMGWIGVGANFDSGVAESNVNARDASDVVRASSNYNSNGVIQSLTRSAAGTTRTRYQAQGDGRIDITSYDAGANEVASAALTEAGQFHIRVTSGGSFAVIDATNGRTMLEAFPGGDIDFKLRDAVGNGMFDVQDSAGGTALGVGSNGMLFTKTNDATGGAGAYVRRIPITYNWNGSSGTIGYLRVYGS